MRTLSTTRTDAAFALSSSYKRLTATTGDCIGAYYTLTHTHLPAAGAAADSALRSSSAAAAAAAVTLALYIYTYVYDTAAK